MLLLWALLIAISGNAQKASTNGKGSISGRITDSATGQPVEFASISLALQTNDQEINGMMTDDKGSFVLINVAEGAYKLSVFSIGYKSGVKNNIVVSKTNPNVTIGNIKLVNASSKLKEVVVAADKNTVEYKVDKTIYNVDKDVTSQTGVATDVLKKIPEVQVDVNGNVELQGNADIRFLINGKPSTIFGNNLADVLQSIPASQIQSIEVITSPGAKYNAEGTAGIINIILKKSEAEGINGNLSLSGGTRLENGSFNFSARKGHVGAHAFLSGNGQLTSATLNSINRFGHDTGSTYSHLLQNGPSNYNRVGYQSGIGLDWDITPKDIVSGDLGYDYFSNNNSGTFTSENTITGKSGNVLSDVTDAINLTQNGHEAEVSWDISYKHTFNKKDHELDIQVSSPSWNNYVHYVHTEQNLLNDSTYSGSYGDNPGSFKEKNISVNYTQPVTENISLEAGAKAVLEDITSTSDVYLLDPATDNYNYSITQSSLLNYKSDVYAGYLSVGLKLFKWLDLKTGIRYEYTQLSASYSPSGNVDIQPYGMFVPSAAFSHTFKNEQTLKLTYSRRIHRPDYFDLSPFVNAGDPQYVFTGNPALQPEISNKIELGYNKAIKKGGNLYLTLFYRLNTHDVQPYSTYYPTYKIGDSTYNNVSVTIPENIGRETNIGTNIFASIPVKKQITLRSNISLFYRDINTGLSTGGNISGFNYSLNLNGTYNFSKTVTAEFFANYNSTRINAQGTYPAFFSYTFAIRKELFGGKGSIAITATNPFNYYVNQTTNLTGNNFTVITINEFPYQSFGFNFTYKFGKLEFNNEESNSNPNDSEDN